MMGHGAGRASFAQRVECPLPKRRGVKDYVFFFVGAADGYGRDEALRLRLAHGRDQHFQAHRRFVSLGMLP
jgi:hypothetical protein